MERLLGHRSPPSALMARGKAVEDGVHAGLIDPSLPVEACVERALATYDREMTLNPDERRDSERLLIPGYVEHGLGELRQYGVPSAYQDRVEIRLDDVPVPLIGFIDWRFDDHGLIVDLKTSERLPSAISLSHARQGAIYARAHGNYGMRFAYVKPTAGKKDGRAVVVYELERAEIDRQIAALARNRAAARTLSRAVDRCPRALRPDRSRLRALPLDQSGHACAWRGSLRLLRLQPNPNLKGEVQCPCKSAVPAPAKPFLKFNAKADKWFFRGATGDDAEIARPTCVMDFDNIATGWMLFREGQAPERVMDPSIDQPAPSPGAEFKRGFLVMTYSPKFFGGAAEFAGTSVHLSNAIKDVYAQYDAERANHRGELPVVACTGSEAIKDRHGTNYRPTFKIVQWVERPADLPEPQPGRCR